MRRNFIPLSWKMCSLVSLILFGIDVNIEIYFFIYKFISYLQYKNLR